MSLTNREAMQALLDGKKIRRGHWDKGEYFIFEEDCLYNHRNNKIVLDFTFIYNSKELWELYEEPKKKKTIKFYEYINSTATQGIFDLHWSMYSPDERKGLAVWFTGNTKEVEIEE